MDDSDQDNEVTNDLRACADCGAHILPTQYYCRNCAEKRHDQLMADNYSAEIEVDRLAKEERRHTAIVWVAISCIFVGFLFVIEGLLS